jgi:hypothetical protein
VHAQQYHYWVANGARRSDVTAVMGQATGGSGGSNPIGTSSVGGAGGSF